MKPRSFFQAFLASILGVALGGCSSTVGSSATDRGADADAAPPSSSACPTNATPTAPPNGPPSAAPHAAGCTAADFAANDRTAEGAERVILAPDGPAPAQFSPRCMRVRVGQTITWQGDLASHPISYTIVATSGGGSREAGSTFVVGDPEGGATQNTALCGEPMTIAFTADDHPTIMFGAVDVVP